ncbi:hypothetical protein ACVINW_006340 [Bradyrhizobium sp. USDA 4461]
MASNYQLYRPAVVASNAASGFGAATLVGTYASQSLAMNAPSVAGDLIIPPGYDWHFTGFRPELTNAALVVGVPQYVVTGGGAGTVANYLGPVQ